MWRVVAVLALAGRAFAVPTPLGQWIWSPADARVFAAARADVPGLEPGVWVATIGVAGDAVVQRLAHPPSLAGAGVGITAVVRFDDSLHRLWETGDDRTVAAAVAPRLTALLAHLDASGVPVHALQLDYDCPVRLLPRWAAVVRALHAGPLAGRTVWLTSLVAHLATPGYGALFGDAIAGHVVQLFDVGEQRGLTPDGLVALLDRAHLPFQLGVGAFERRRADGGTTQHARWWRALPRVAASPWYRGTWVFAAGRSWRAAWMEAQ